MNPSAPAAMAILTAVAMLSCNDPAQPPRVPAVPKTPEASVPVSTTPPATARWLDDASPIAILPSDEAFGSRDALVTIVRANKADDADPLAAPQFQSWLRSTYGPDRVRFVRVEESARSDRFFRAYGTLTFINGVRNFAVAYADARAVTADYALIIDAEIAAAEAAIANGTPRERIYVERSTRNVENAAYASHDPKHPILDTTTLWRVPLGSSPSLGPSEALVTAVLFCAPMTPVCRWFYDHVRALVPAHSLRFVFRAYADKLSACDAEAVGLATAAARAKGAASYFTALEALEDVQPKIVFATDGQRDDQAWNVAVQAGKAPSCGNDVLEGMAKRLGIRAAAATSLRGKPVDAELAANLATADTIEGRNALFVNGRRLGFVTHGEPAPNLSEAGIAALLERVVAEEEARARARVAQGESARTLYETIVRSGYVSVH